MLVIKHPFNAAGCWRHAAEVREEHSALRYDFGVDPRTTLATESRLVRENQTADWTPTEETRRAKLSERLDPDFYAGTIDKYFMPDELAKISSNQAAFCAGNSTLHAPASGRCAKAKKGALYHAWRDCPLGGVGKWGSSAAYCQPVDASDAVALRSLALCQVCQEATDAGGYAFAAVVEMHGAPAVLRDGGDTEAFDVSAYGFTTGARTGGGAGRQWHCGARGHCQAARRHGGLGGTLRSALQRQQRERGDGARFRWCMRLRFMRCVSDSSAPTPASGGELAAGGVDETHAGMEIDEEDCDKECIIALTWVRRSTSCGVRRVAGTTSWTRTPVRSGMLGVAGEFSVGVEDFVSNNVNFGLRSLSCCT
ncbi:hypothetical protein CYMTET_15688 [Cymbomonas tetramitiformis]|uniref:Uncharacterized protein n=1 Tax=Cymbomonas tetramitiformis TaxID=36881 RepID=A0AAE0GDQ2_9CHLO|nr:hypothetical protein CYMTET_15688 [Cymbomonas tetramitiformis]